MARNLTVEIAPPPRRVSWTAAIQIVFGGMRQAVWVIAALLTIFVWIFAADSELMTKIEMRGPRRSTTGVVVSIRNTSASENRSRIVAVDYRYRVDGREYRGTSYAVHKQLPPIGSTVLVEHRASHPSRSRIRGLRLHRFGAAGGLLFIPYAAVLVVAVLRLIQALRDVRLLARGELALAKVVEKTATSMRIQRQRIFRYTLQVDAPPAPREVSYRESAPRPTAHRFEVRTHRTAAIEREALVPVLFERDAPDRGLAIEALAVRPAPGGFDAPATALWTLLLPSFVVLGNVVFLILR